MDILNLTLLTLQMESKIDRMLTIHQVSRCIKAFGYEKESKSVSQLGKIFLSVWSGNNIILYPIEFTNCGQAIPKNICIILDFDRADVLIKENNVCSEIVKSICEDLSCSNDGSRSITTLINFIENNEFVYMGKFTADFTEIVSKANFDKYKVKIELDKKFPSIPDVFSNQEDVTIEQWFNYLLTLSIGLFY